MKLKAKFHRLASHELRDSAAYYEEKRSGLGTTFVVEVERAVARIVDHPESGRVILGHVRRQIVPRFPYSLLYAIKPDHVRILAVMHSKRRPMYWVGRH